ncbi:MAG: alpha-galactosidase [Anaerolineae bacterium]|nr:alpha-galactosidase [Anaerolineae bacterium]
MPLIPFIESPLHLSFQTEGEHFRVARYSLDGQSWLNAASVSPAFAVYVNGERHDVTTLPLRGWRVDDGTTGIRHLIATFAGAGFAVEHHVLAYDNAALTEQWQVIRATGTAPVTVTRIDSVALDIPSDGTDLLSFTSDWGQEFQPVRRPLADGVTLETRAGRSSKGQHPWFALFAGDGSVLSGSVAWSGNWIFRFEPLAAGGYRLTGGLHDWNFSKTLSPGESMESARVALALGGRLNAVARQYARVGRRWWYPPTRPAAALPVEWNHWWSYEDADIDETVFRANIDAAAALGVELCTLDAGWFGYPDAATDWQQHRGDWDVVNTARFPSGIRALADAAHDYGMKFGLWCEIEGLGAKAALNEFHPEFAARRDGAALGYVCLGSPAAQEWAYQVLSQLIRNYACDWIKVDFNLDPAAGCSRTDHGHGAGDGLYAHYQGYYRLLERIRHDYPAVVLENCSSGGQRIDLGMLRHTDLTFLSDPDYPVHNLQVFWGATTMLAPDACLHWSFSEWRGNGPPQQNFNPRDPALQPHQLDYYTRTAMLGAFGLSQKLPDLPKWVVERLAQHIAVYKRHVRRFVREAELSHLTDQPRRDGRGDRWCAFQYSLHATDEHLLFVFRLPGAEPSRTIHLCDLQPERVYQFENLNPGGEPFAPMHGRDLTQTGLVLDHLREEDSALLRLF